MERVVTPAQIDEMKRLRQKGKTFREIGQIIGVSRSTVGRYVENKKKRENRGPSFVTWFTKEWSRIYPGDEKREEIKNVEAGSDGAIQE